MVVNIKDRFYVLLDFKTSFVFVLIVFRVLFRRSRPSDHLIPFLCFYIDGTQKEERLESVGSVVCYNTVTTVSEVTLFSKVLGLELFLLEKETVYHDYCTPIPSRKLKHKKRET